MAPPARGGAGGAPIVDVGEGGDGGYYPAPPPFPFSFHRMELTVISAQDLYPAARSMRTYAVAYLRLDHRVRTRTDPSGHADPSWNEKFVFRVDDAVLRSDTSAITIDVYASRPSLLPGSDTLLGTARALLSTLRPSSATHYAALQVRRPSLRPQGILNISVSLVEPVTRSPAPHADPDPSPANHRSEVPTPKRPAAAGTSRPADREKTELERKLEKWRAELPAVSGEVVREERGGRIAPAPVAPAAVENGRWQRRRSFGRMTCFGGEVDTTEFVAPAPPPPMPQVRFVKERPAKRVPRDAINRN